MLGKANMTDTTLEEAKRCPTCQTPGKQVSTKRAPQGAPRGAKILVLECESSRCESEGERWVVQLNPDGTIPQPGRKGPKQFDLPGPQTGVAQRARDDLALIDFMTTHPTLTEREARRAMGF
jgi:hypothetical protein